MEDINAVNEDGLFKIPETSPYSASPMDSEEEEEFDAKSFLDKLYNDTVEDMEKAKAVAVADTPTERQIAYGIEQETTLLGNALRYAKALSSSFENDVSFGSALKYGEYERQQGIKKDYTEYKYLTEEEESMAMIGGRVAVGVADPLTVLVPWIKIAKIGKVSSVAINAGIFGVDAAARDQLLYGEVNPITFGVSTVLGGVGGLASAAIYGKKGASALVEIANDPKAVDKIPVVNTITAPPVLTESENIIIAESAQSLFTFADIIKRISEVSATGTNLTLRAEPINQMKAVLSDMQALEKAVTRKERISTLEAAEKKTKKILTDSKGQFAEGTEAKLLDEANTLAARLKILREAPKRPTPAYKSELAVQIKNLQAKIEEATTNLYSGHISKATASADMTGDIIEDLASKGKLTDNIMAGLVSQITRPVIGGVGGFATGATLGDDDDDTMLAALVGLGVGAGVLSKRLNTLKLTGFDLENVKMTVNNTASSSLLGTIKILSAGTTATKLDAYGGWMKVIGNLLLQKPGAATNAVETTYASDVSKYMNKVVNIFGDSYKNKSVKEVVTAVSRGWISADSLVVGYKGINNGLKKGLTAEDINEVRRIVPAITKEQDTLKQSMRDAGIKFSELDNYGMAQLWDFKNIADKGIDNFQKDAVIAFTIQDQNRVAAGVLKKMTSPEALEAKAIDFVNKIRGIKTKADEDSIAHSGLFNKNGDFIPLTDHFERKRVITDVEATGFMAEKGWLTLDPIEISAQYADKSIKVRNFANVFGANGELINRAFADIEKTLGGKGKTAEQLAFHKKYKEQLRGTLNAFWGVHGEDEKRRGSVAHAMAATITTLANVSYLPRVAVSSIGDLIQPIQNSGVLSTLKASKFIAPGVKSFASRAGFQYDKSWERELQAFQTKGADPLSTIHKNLDTANRVFFTMVGLSPLTKLARTFAYDAGVYRAFDIATKVKKSKGKISKSLQTEINGLGVDKDQLMSISKFKNAEEAFSDTDANVILDMAGRRSADRDAIVPIVGNRLLFTQSKNPYVKATGQFLSWAQAKSAQSNYLIQRLEDGDAKLAVRMLTGAVVYAGVGALKQWVKPNYDEYNPDNVEAVSVKGIQKGLAISGNFLPWQIDKIVDTLSTPDYRNITSNIAPALNIIDDLWVASKRVSEDPSRLANLPVINELTSYYERMNRAAGGVVDVPNAPEKPEQRIDKMTGVPYDQQAGGAFVDNDDPLRRLGFKGGGVVTDPLKRMGFGIGGAVVKLGTAALKSVDDDIVPILSEPLKTTKELIEEGKKLSNAVMNNLDEALLANSASRTTQRANTVATATKASSYLDSLGATGKSLDYGAGKGLNAQANKIDDTFEPFPDESFVPTFKSPKEVPEDTYGKIISTNVINVLPPDLRKEAIMNIGKSLKVGGKALIQTWDVGAAKKGMSSSNAKPVKEESLAYTTSTGSYQKGFTIGELKNYVADVLGKSFEVSTVPSKQGISGVAVVISKTGQAQKKVDDVLPTDDIEMSGVSSAIFGFGRKPKAPVVDKIPEEIVVEPAALSFEKVADDLVLNTEGKSLADVTRYVGIKGLEAGKEDYKIIADKVANQLDALAKEGFSFDYQIARLKSGSTTDLEKPAPTSLVRGGAAGVANFSGADKKVSVFISDITARDSLANGMNTQTILHESIHAATMASIRVGNLKAQEGTKLHKDVKDLYSLFNFVIADFNKKAKDPASLGEYETKIFRRMNNSMESVDEIVAWGLTNSDMQKYLESIKYGTTNAWTAFVQQIRTILGMSAKEDTALSELLRVSDSLLSADVKQVVSALDNNITQKVKYVQGGLVLKSLKRTVTNV
jgi:hypothetical protein